MYGTTVRMLWTPTGICTITVGVWVITAGMYGITVRILWTPTGICTITVVVWVITAGMYGTPTVMHFYNSQRLHSTLGYVSPNVYEL